jgi:hypothetical protein
VKKKFVLLVKDNMKKTIAVLSLVVLLNSCIAAGIGVVVSKILPSSWDDNEMLMISNIRYDIRKIKCKGTGSAESIEKVWSQKEKLWYYAESANHSDVVELIVPFSESMQGLYDQSKAGTLREPYCVNKVVNLTTQADMIASALASRNK